MRNQLSSLDTISGEPRVIVEDAGEGVIGIWVVGLCWVFERFRPLQKDRQQDRNRVENQKIERIFAFASLSSVARSFEILNSVREAALFKRPSTSNNNEDRTPKKEADRSRSARELELWRRARVALAAKMTRASLHQLSQVLISWEDPNFAFSFAQLFVAIFVLGPDSPPPDPAFLALDIYYFWMDDSKSFEIYRVARECKDVFARCVADPELGQHVWIRSAQGDFNLWCAGINVTRTDKSSLDYRLRTKTEVRDVVYGLVRALIGALERCWSLVAEKSRLDGGLAIIEEEPQPDPEDMDPESPQSCGSWDAMSNESKASASSSGNETSDPFLSEQISYAKTILGQLQRISLAIRKSGNKYRFEKADATLDENRFEDFRKHLTTVILMAFEDKMARELTAVQKMDKLSDYERLTPIQRRMVRANILRMNRIEFFTKSTRTAMLVVKPEPAVDAGGLAVVEAAVKPAIAYNDKTGVINSHQDDKDRVFTGLSSLPRCKIKRIVDEMYLTAESLLAHMFERHSVIRWTCDYCAYDASKRNESTYEGPQQFDTAEEWRSHIAAKHGDMKLSSQLATLGELNKRPMIGPLACPLCQFTTDSVDTEIDDHILQHLHEFALRALPEGSEETDNQESQISEGSGLLSHTHMTGVDKAIARECPLVTFQEVEDTMNNARHLLVTTGSISLPSGLKRPLYSDAAATELWQTESRRLTEVLHTLEFTSQNNMEWGHPDIRDVAVEVVVQMNSVAAVNAQPSLFNQINSLQYISVPSPPSYLIGQEDILNKLEDLLLSVQFSSQQLRIALVGQKGIGKTSIARTFVSRIRQHPSACSIFWVNASSEDDIERSYDTIMREFGEPPEWAGSISHRIQLFVHYLTWTFKGRWLIILDGLQHQTALYLCFEKLLPQGLNGTLLFTASDVSCFALLGPVETIQVPKLQGLRVLYPNPLDTNGLCLLSLDGGSVRGLSTLYILKDLMTRLNNERISAGLLRVKPCEVFDLIGGTSTGGLMAIMLGRLEMDVDACIAAYSELIKAVFEEKSSWLPVSWSGKVKARFDSAKLKSAVENVISKTDTSLADAFNDGKKRGCRTFVCATVKETASITRLRSYTLPDEGEIPATVCQAALATLAATDFFDPVSIGAHHFVNGALGANNPVNEVEGEAANIWSSGTGDLKPLVKCFISIGTGYPSKKALEDNIAKFLSKSLVGIATETEETERKFIVRWAKHYDEKRYFRFNIDRGLQEIGLAEYKEQGRIEAATSEYLQHQAQRFRVRDCIENLQQKQGKTELSFALIMHEHTIRHTTQSQRVRNVHWIVPRLVNHLFTGRLELLDRIRSALRNDSEDAIEHKRLVITGMAGIGKSEVCLKIADLLQEDFWGVFWVDVSSLSTAQHGFLAIAKALGSSAESVEESLQALANTPDRWLLILDSADNPAFDYAAYIPSGRRSVVIITSRVPECSQYSTLPAETLEGLEDEHSTQLLLKAARVPQASWQACGEQAQAIVQLLGSHTLALIQAGTYIAEGYCRLDQYTEKYERLRERLLNHYPKQEQSRYRHVYATFEASIPVLKDSEDEASQDALDLLGVLSMLHSSVLPFNVFLDAWRGARDIIEANSYQNNEIDDLGQWHVYQLPKFIDSQANEWDNYRLNRASDLLASLSLVTRHRSDDLDGFSMHPLAHAWAKDRLGQEQQQTAWIGAGCIIALSQGESETWQMYERQLRPHMQSFLSARVQEMLSFGPPGTILPILLKCGWVLNTMREDGRLKELLDGIYKVLQITPLDPSQEHVRIWDLAARNLGYLGYTRQAIGLLEHVVKMREAALAETHPSRLALQHELAGAYRANGQTKEAVQLLEHVVKVYETMLAETHPNRLTLQHELAGAYRANGQTKEAVQLLEHVVKVRKTTLAETHPDRLASQHELASAYQANGQINDIVPDTKSAMRMDLGSVMASARFSKGDVVQKPIFVNGMRTKGVFTIYDRRRNPAGYVEYRLKNFYDLKVESGWTREKELKPGS
ncbi:hypothetical protein yc1106_02027 [Curvularia clavata]|uniref:PNPLA domain-containing protein n=1 Tax=Curvularia clavata TaxID=95742 RepID=A0A9Q9DP47_CURCL|nr:hypothetical protein yc1106_02027 [Curvularia clavata]